MIAPFFVSNTPSECSEAMNASYDQRTDSLLYDADGSHRRGRGAVCVPSRYASRAHKRVRVSRCPALDAAEHRFIPRERGVMRLTAATSSGRAGWCLNATSIQFICCCPRRHAGKLGQDWCNGLRSGCGVRPLRVIELGQSWTAELHPTRLARPSW